MEKRIEKGLDEMPLFTVAVVSYDQARFIKECIDSVLSQDYGNIELVICDDHGCDFDQKELLNYINIHKGNNIKNVIVRQNDKNIGISLNCQTALELSHGKYLKFHAADDMLADKSSLSMIAGVFEKEQCNVIFSRARACTNAGVPTKNIYPYNHNFVAASKMNAEELFTAMATKTWGAYVCAPAAYFKVSFLKEMGGFDPTYKYMEDWPFWLKMLKNGHLPFYHNKITVLYRYGGISNRQGDRMWQMSKLHLRECAALLENEALPVLLERKNRSAARKCRQCIDAVRSKDAVDIDWIYMSRAEKAYWFFANRGFLIRGWWDRKKNTPVTMRGLIQTVKYAVGWFAAAVICFARNEYCFEATFFEWISCGTHFVSIVLWTVALLQAGAAVGEKVVSKRGKK